MKAVILSLVLLASFSQAWLAHAGETVPLRFENLPELLRKGNQTVEGSERIKRAAERRTGYLARSFSPTLEVEAGGEVFHTGAHDVETQPYGKAEAKLNLYRGGRDQLEEEARKEQSGLSDASGRKTFTNELTQVRNLFWTLVHQREMITLFKQVLEQNEQYLKRAARKIERGLSTPTDRLEFEIHRSQLQEEIESLQHANKLTQIELSALLGMTQDTHFSTVESIAHVHDEELMSSSRDTSFHPDIALLQANERLFQVESKQFGRSWFPELDIYGGYYAYTLRERDYTQMNLRDDWVGGAKLTLRLWDGAQSQSSAQSKNLQAEGFRLQIQQKLQNLSAESEVTKEYLRHDHELIHASEERLVQGKKYLELTLKEYSRGVKNSIDVLSASQKHFGFAKQYAERRKDYQLTKNKLLALLGR